MSADYQAIAERAYQLWESKGRPEGEHEQIWIDAERELQQPEGKRSQADVGNTSEEPKTSESYTAAEKSRRR